MKQLEKLTGLAAFLLISGCAATMTRDAQRVVLHTQLSAVVSDCKKLGIVTGEDEGVKSVELKEQQATNNMRDNAFKQYQADTVVLVNVDVIGGGWNQKGLSRKEWHINAIEIIPHESRTQCAIQKYLML